MGKIKEALGKAFEIANSSMFRVKIYHNDSEDTKDVENWTYMQLGLYLNSNQANIEQVDIILIPED